MTENEAKEWIKYLGNQNLPYDRSPKSRKLACDIAIQALEEIQQYRAIGTIEEFKDLKEKSVAKKPIIRGLGQRYCPVCKCGGADHFYCTRCGQKLG